MITTPELIKLYNLQPHPEGGHYKENYRSSEVITRAGLPERFDGDRVFSTAIYFLLSKGDFSAYHRIKADECWHFYTGGPLFIYVLQLSGELEIVELGNDISKGQLFQYIVPANCWFASRPAPESEFCFVGCTVAPGFDFADFEMADAATLINEYPQYEMNITQLCRE